MRPKLRSLFGPALLLVILASGAFVYSEGALDANYQGEDYLFLSQGARSGLAKSIVIPYKDHVIPLYRLGMGGLHLLFENAVPIRVALLLFHLANIALIFYIIRRRTGSAVLAAAASGVFGLSQQAPSVLLFPVNGNWVVSLCFVLVMYVCLDKFLDSQDSQGPFETESPNENAARRITGSEETSSDAEQSAPSLSTRDLTDITLRPAEWKMRYYYAALASFVAGLGFFTMALVGGGVVWTFAYARLLRQGDFRRSLRLQAKVALPFIMIVGVYLFARSHFNEISHPHFDSMCRNVMERPGVTPARALEALAGLPADSYATLLQRTTPFHEEYYIFAIIALGLLLIKEMLVRREEAAVAFMWLGFTAITLAVPVASRLFFVLRGSGVAENILSPCYFYTPVAGVAITFGLLLRPPPGIEKKLKGLSAPGRGLLAAVALAILAALSFENAKEIRSYIPGLVVGNQRFDELLAGYENSMTSFLESPAYLPEQQYYFKDSVSAGRAEFPTSWNVMRHDIFYLTFPDKKNVHFISGYRHHGDLYFWSPDGIISGESPQT